MNYLKAMVSLFFIIGFGLTFTLMAPVVGRIFIFVSAALFILYVVMNFVIKGQSKHTSVADVLALLTGLMAVVTAIVTAASMYA